LALPHDCPPTHPLERARLGIRCLIGPYNRDPERLADQEWIDRGNPGRTYRLRLDNPYELSDDTIAAQTSRDYFESYRNHMTRKCSAPAATAATTEHAASSNTTTSSPRASCESAKSPTRSSTPTIQLRGSNNRVPTPRLRWLRRAAHRPTGQVVQ
jgi:hypothetical protein